MSETPPELEPSPTAQEMADSLRSGLETRRRYFGDDPSADASRLRAAGDVEGLPPHARPGAAAPVIRWMRGALRAVLRPWLAAQTVFNREVATQLGDTMRAVRDLERRLPLLEKAIQHVDARTQCLDAGSRTSRELDSQRSADTVDVLAI